MKSDQNGADVVGAGLVSLDHLFVDTTPLTSPVLRRAPHLQPLLERVTQHKDTSGGSPEGGFKYLGSYGGGSVCNTLCYLSLLGFKTSVIGVVGVDEQGKLVRADLDSFGVGHEYLIRSSRFSTRQYAHLVFPGRSQDHIYSQKCPVCKTRFQETARLHPEDLTQALGDLIAQSSVFHVDRPSEANSRLADIACSQNKIVSFDFGYYAEFYTLEHVLSIVRSATILKTSSHAASRFLKVNNLKSFRDINPNLRLYVNTLGTGGIEGYFQRDGTVVPFSRPALPCPRFLESGGAGDAFHAGLLYKILTDGIDSLGKSLEVSLDFCQALASICCMFIGARGYLMSILRDSADLRRLILRDVEELIGSKSERVVGKTMGFPEPRTAWTHDTALFCPACGRATKFLLTPNYYELKLEASPALMAAAFGREYEPASLDVSPIDRVFVVGSGGSFSVAIFCELLLNWSLGACAFALSPYDFVQFGRPDSKVLLISYGGNNPDIVSAFNRAVDVGARQIFALTGDRSSRLSRLVRSHERGVVYHVTDDNKDTNFVSTIGMLSTISGALSLLRRHVHDPSLPDFFECTSLRKFFDLAKHQAEQEFEAARARFPDMKRRHIVALGSGWARPALIDFDSKITEGAVSSIEISETKNYTHGRYLNAYLNKTSTLFVLFSTGTDTALVDFLEQRLKRDFPVLLLRSERTGPRASLELMVRQLQLTNVLAKNRGLDIGRPRFPQEARGLYSWGPIYRPREPARGDHA